MTFLNNTSGKIVTAELKDGWYKLSKGKLFEMLSKEDFDRLVRLGAFTILNSK